MTLMTPSVEQAGLVAPARDKKRGLAMKDNKTKIKCKIIFGKERFQELYVAYIKAKMRLANA